MMHITMLNSQLGGLLGSPELEVGYPRIGGRRFGNFLLLTQQLYRAAIISPLTIFVTIQAQTALHRKWAQWKSAWGKTGWGETRMASNSFNYHTNSTTETSRATISLEQPAAPFKQSESSRFLSSAEQTDSGQEKNCRTCGNGEVDPLNKLEMTRIWQVKGHVTFTPTRKRGSFGGELSTGHVLVHTFSLQFIWTEMKKTNLYQCRCSRIILVVVNMCSPLMNFCLLFYTLFLKHWITDT